MLQALDDDVISMIASTFRLHVLNAAGAGKDESWDWLLALLIPKLALPKHMEQCRPIGLLPVLLNSY